jgi:hypothetical protein
MLINVNSMKSSLTLGLRGQEHIVVGPCLTEKIFSFPLDSTIQWWLNITIIPHPPSILTRYKRNTEGIITKSEASNQPKTQISINKYCRSILY